MIVKITEIEYYSTQPATETRLYNWAPHDPIPPTILAAHFDNRQHHG